VRWGGGGDRLSLYVSVNDSGNGNVKLSSSVSRTLAVTPSKSKSLPWDDVYRVCHEYTMAGLSAIFDVRGTNKTTPLRFLYMSGIAAERDQSKSPKFMPKYCLMRVCSSHSTVLPCPHPLHA
jgi:hypothetical protein